MSKLVLLEGSLIQRIKNKDNTDVYVILTQEYLKIYRSQIAYQQNPNNPLKIIDFANQYNLLPMHFDTALRFSLFKRGEKAEERLYLEASTKSDYDLWLSQIDKLISRTFESDVVSVAKTSVTDTETRSSTSNVAMAPTLDQLDKGAAQKPTNTRYNIKTTSPTTETRQACDKLEADLRNERKNVVAITKEKETLQERGSVLDKKVFELEKEKNELASKVHELNKQIDNLNQSIIKNKEYSDQQLDKASNFICRGFNSSKFDSLSYKFLVNYLCADSTNSTILTSFLTHQLEYLIHKLPLDADCNQSLYQYFTNSVNMSLDSLTRFVSTFLLTLSKQVNPTSSSKCDLMSIVNSLVSSVVHAVPPSQLSSSKQSFQQTALDISYLLNPETLDESQISNGFSDPTDVNEQFDSVLSSSGIESVNKVFIVELSKELNVKYRDLASNNGRIENNGITENLVNGHFGGRWKDLHLQLETLKSHNNDLQLTLHQLSAVNQSLEEANRTKHEDWRDLDKLINYYASMSEKLCNPCQLNVVNILKMPVTDMVDKLVDDFVCYWRCLNEMTNFLAKKKIISVDVKDSIDMVKRSTSKFEALVPQLQEITQRTIHNPGTSG